MKKLNKLKDDLSKLLRTVSSEGYKNAASDLVQKNHNERVNLEKSIFQIDRLINLNFYRLNNWKWK